MWGAPAVLGAASLGWVVHAPREAAAVRAFVAEKVNKTTDFGCIDRYLTKCITPSQKKRSEHILPAAAAAVSLISLKKFPTVVNLLKVYQHY